MAYRSTLFAAVLLSWMTLLAAAAPGDPAVAKLVAEGKDLLDRWHGDRGFLIEADKRIGAALKLDPKSVPAMVQRARLLLAAGWDGQSAPVPEAAKAAEEMLLAAIAIDANVAEAHSLLGHVYTHQKQLYKARKSLGRATEMGFTDPWLFLNWASYYKATEEMHKVVPMSEKALATGKANIKAQFAAHHNIYWYYTEMQSDRKRADESYKALLALNPANVYTRGNYARTLGLVFRDFAAAEELAREALAIMEYPHAKASLSIALYGQWAEAIDRSAPAVDVRKLYAKASEFDPNASLIPECETRRNSLQSVVKHLAAKGISPGTQYRC